MRARWSPTTSVRSGRAWAVLKAVAVLAWMGISVITAISGVAGGQLIIPTIVLLYPWTSFPVLRRKLRFPDAAAAGVVLGPVVGACWRDGH